MILQIHVSKADNHTVQEIKLILESALQLMYAYYILRPLIPNNLNVPGETLKYLSGNCIL